MCLAMSESANKPSSVESRVVEADNSGLSAVCSSIVHKSAIALRDKENAFDILGSAARKIVLEVKDGSAWIQVANPNCKTGLLGFPWRSSRI